MDLLSSVSRWLVHKRVEMHQLFEQWAQGCPKTERVSSLGSSKRLTHSQAGGSVLNILKRLPMNMSNVTSDKSPYETGVMGDQEICYNMAFPVVGPQDKPDFGPVPINCVGGQFQSAPPMQTQCQHQPNYNQSGFQKLMPGMNRNGLYGSGPKGGQSSTPPSFPPDVSKSPMWKHIFAPPFIPASCKRKYPYGMENSEPAPVDGWSNIYPYVHHFGPSPQAGESTHLPSYVTPQNGQRCAQATQLYPSPERNYGHVEHHAFTPVLNGGTSQTCAPSFIPFMFQVGVHPSHAPGYQVQVVFSPQAQATHSPQQTCVPTSVQTESRTGRPSQPPPSHRPSQRTVPKELWTPSSSEGEVQVDPISEVVIGINSIHLSPQPAKQEVVTPQSEGFVPSERQSTQTAKKELACDIPKDDSVSKQEPMSPFTCQKTEPTMVTFEEPLRLNVEGTSIQPNPLHPVTPQQSSTRDFTFNKQAQTPNTHPRRRRKTKSRPSAEKRRRRRMAAVCTISKKPECPEESNSSKKLKTDHQSEAKPTAAGKSKHTTIAFILGLDSDDEDSSDSESSEGRAQHKTYCSFSISSLNSDSDFDDDFDNLDSCDGNIQDAAAWGELNISLDPFNPFNFQCFSAAPKPIPKTSSAPELSQLDQAVAGSPEARYLHPRSPRRKSLFGKRVSIFSHFEHKDLLLPIYFPEC